MSKALAAIAKAKSEQILKESDAEASVSSHDSDDEAHGIKKLKKESEETFEVENGAKGSSASSPNGMGSPRELMENSLNGTRGASPKGMPLVEEAIGKGLLAGYHTYSPDQKQEVVIYARETTVREAARKYHVPRSTVQVWCKHGGQIKREKRCSGVGGRRLSYSNETDDSILQWVLKEQELGTLVTRDGIQAQARYLIREECPDFKASSGWVEKFLTRHNLTIATKMSSTNPNAVPISYVVPMSSVMTIPSPGSVGHGANSPRADGRSFTSEETRSDSGKSEEDDDLDDATPNMETVRNAGGQPLIREPPNLSELLRPLQNASSPASASLRDDEEDDGEGEDGEAETEKTEPANINPERLKAFNMFVRLFVDENLDRLVPISKQPKDKIMAIIHSCQRQFPEFRDRARKRIRTYLKSCRRLKKLKEPLKRAADQMNILASACASEAENVKKPKLEDDVSPTSAVLSNTSSVMATTTVTSRYKDRLSENGGLPSAKPKILSQCQISPSEVQAIRQLIAGYRESAAFLYRSADELEALLPPV